MSALYHYCSAATFLSIISNHSIFLSSLLSSNDKYEGRLISEKFAQLLEKNGVDIKIRLDLRKDIEKLQDFVDCFGFCLSEHGDALSQWRGYANDGKGFSIGFSKEFLSEDSFLDGSKLFLSQAMYSDIEHERLLFPLFEKIINSIESGDLGVKGLIGHAQHPHAREAKSEWFRELMKYIPIIFQLKHEAFYEEKEWRLIRVVAANGSDGVGLDFRALEDRIVQYIKLDIFDSTYDPIQKIVIGPKNATPIHVIEALLKKYGYNNVVVTRSEAPYR